MLPNQDIEDFNLTDASCHTTFILTVAFKISPGSDSRQCETMKTFIVSTTFIVNAINIVEFLLELVKTIFFVPSPKVY